MSKRNKKLKAEISRFLDQYARRAHSGQEPNDRNYDRKLEEKLKRLSPEEWAEFLEQNEDDD